jgi:hypothetical protein
VTATRYDEGVGTLPPPHEHGHPGDTYMYHLKSTGALNGRAGRTLTISEDDLAYCRTGVSDHRAAPDLIGSS